MALRRLTVGFRAQSSSADPLDVHDDHAYQDRYRHASDFESGIQHFPPGREAIREASHDSEEHGDDSFDRIASLQ
jgi:hypothetical protein